MKWGASNIEVIDVNNLRVNHEDGGDVLLADVRIAVEKSLGGIDHTEEYLVPCTCWADTDDDGAEWCAANEGALALHTAWTGHELTWSGPRQTSGDFVRLAFPAECEELGALICASIRAAAGS